MKRVTILGSTGSIGTQAIDVCKRIGYKIVALAANSSAGEVIKQARELLPRYVILVDDMAYQKVKTELADTSIEVLCGISAMCDIAASDEADIVLNAISGVSGLMPTLAALRAGRTVALANKETLVVGGALIKREIERSGGKIIPVDSEHTAIFQCLNGESSNRIKKIILTASGGPFFGKTKDEIANATITDVMNHPKWNMGRKITVDSATLMNKGLEFIECIWNFGVTPDQIEVVIHPEVIIHSAVEFEDNSIIAQMSEPDMRLSIQYALTYPSRLESSVKQFSFTDMTSLTFFKPDLDTFGCLALSIDAIRAGGLAPCILNAADEIAVASFLDGRISFGGIYDAVSSAVHSLQNKMDFSVEDIWETDRKTREYVEAYIKERL